MAETSLQLGKEDGFINLCPFKGRIFAGVELCTEAIDLAVKD